MEIPCSMPPSRASSLPLVLTGCLSVHMWGPELTLRMLSASLWLTPLVLRPLMESTLSPFWMRPSLSAKLPAITLCTWKKSVSSVTFYEKKKNYLSFYSVNPLIEIAK